MRQPGLEPGSDVTSSYTPYTTDGKHGWETSVITPKLLALSPLHKRGDNFLAVHNSSVTDNGINAQILFLRAENRVVVCPIFHVPATDSHARAGYVYVFFREDDARVHLRVTNACFVVTVCRRFRRRRNAQPSGGIERRKGDERRRAFVVTS